jgi:GMP synthase (glutamine-hydrolysing)
MTSDAARPSVVVLQHVAPEHPGLLGNVLAARGFAIRTVRTWLGEPVPKDLQDASALVVMGGPMGVHDTGPFPNLRDEAHRIEMAIAADLPILGVCLGSQLLAKVLGAKIGPGPRKEIGWHRVHRPLASADDALFAGAPSSFFALHWHGDAFDFPSSTVGLARSDLTPHQAFRFGRAAYGILFHLEVSREMMKDWVTSSATEISAEGIEGEAILADSDRLLPSAAPIGGGIFE